MGEERAPQRWWQTVPGMLTAAAAAITAATGLVAALNQTGLFSAGRKPVAPVENSAGRPADLGRPAEGPGTAAKTPVAAGTLPRRLPAGEEVHLGNAVYKLLAAKLDRYNPGTLALTFTVRMTNNADAPDNFWDASFRLLLDGVPKAPVSGLNTLVYGHSAEEGDVVFVVPVSTEAAVLRMAHTDQSADIAVDLSAAAAPAEK